MTKQKREQTVKEKKAPPKGATPEMKVDGDIDIGGKVQHVENLTAVERAAVVRATGVAAAALYNHYGKGEARVEASLFMKMLLDRLRG